MGAPAAVRRPGRGAGRGASARAAWPRTRRDLARLLRTAGQGVLEPVWHELLTLELPVLALAGARDEGYASAAQQIAEHRARARASQIVEDAGHAPQLQQPERVAALIAAFAGLRTLALERATAYLPEP